MYFFNLMDYQTAGISLLVVSLMEIIIIGWIYGERLVLPMYICIYAGVFTALKGTIRRGYARKGYLFQDLGI